MSITPPWRREVLESKELRHERNEWLLVEYNIIQDDCHASSEARSMSACMCTWGKLSFYLTKISQGALFLIKAPLITIAANAGVDGAIFIVKLLEQGNVSLGHNSQ